jgi:hypothetical protein
VDGFSLKFAVAPCTRAGGVYGQLRKKGPIHVRPEEFLNVFFTNTILTEKVLVGVRAFVGIGFFVLELEKKCQRWTRPRHYLKPNRPPNALGAPVNVKKEVFVTRATIGENENELYPRKSLESKKSYLESIIWPNVVKL